MWSYLANPFLSLAKRNYKQFLLFTRDHRDKLQQWQNDVDIAPLYQRMQLAYTRYENKYADINTNAALYHTKTRIFETLLTELSSKKIRSWDVQVQVVYDQDSPEYAGIFSNGRKPFQSGAYDLRISALTTLAAVLSTYPALANVLAEVQTFTAQMEIARTAQQGIESTEQLLRTEIEGDALHLANEMHYIFMMLQAKHFTNISMVENYYELKYLRAGTKDTSIAMQTHTVSANNRITMYAGQLNNNSYLVIKNTGTIPLLVFTSNDIAAAIPFDAYALQPNEILDGVYADALSDGNGFATLIIVNQESNDGKCEVGKE